MKTRIYSIFDNKAKAYLTPYFHVNDLQGQRYFHRLVNDKQTDINAFPNDFALYCVGEFDTESGEVTPFAAPDFLVNAISLKE